MRFVFSVAARLCAAALLGLAPVAAPAAQAQDPAGIQQLLDSVLAANPGVPGLAVHLESPRLGISWTGVAGLADRDRGVPLSPRHGHRIASNTKTYVAAAILRLWEQGRLGLDDPVARHLSPEAIRLLRGGGYDPAAIRIRHLLSHTSGLYDYAMDSAYQARVNSDPQHRWTPHEQIAFGMERGAPYGAPGERYHYSDTGYVLLGEILERLTGRPLAAALRTLLRYDRLGLASTWLETLEPPPASAADRAHQFFGAADTYGFDPSLDLFGGGGLVATTRDMAVFTRALFTGGVYDRPATADTMLTRLPARDLTGYRFGIGETSFAGFRGYGHTGFWNTFSYYFPDLDLGLAGSILQTGAYAAAPPLVSGILTRLRPERGRLLAELEDILRRALAADTTIPGAALHLESPSRGLSWSGAAGVGDRATGRPLRPDQPVRIASNTKTYVAAGVLRLVEDGRLGLDDPIDRHLGPDYVAVLRQGGYDPARITVRHLLQHTSGLFDYAMSEPYGAAVMGAPGRRWTRMDQVRFAMEHGAPYGPPGTGFHYSDTGYVLLGEILERRTGMGLGPALRTLVGFERLGLTRTWLESLEPDPWFAGARAHQYQGPQDTWAFDPSIDLYGGGGLAATVRDMALFTRALLTGRVFRAAATLDTMLTRPPVAAERDYRMGIYRAAPGGIGGFGHTGYWGTFAFHFPELDLTVAGTLTQQTAGRSLLRMLAEAVDAVRRS